MGAGPGKLQFVVGEYGEDTSAYDASRNVVSGPASDPTIEPPTDLALADPTALASFVATFSGPFLPTFTDDSPPVTTASLNLPDPDGSDGWYTHPVLVTVRARDSGSGVAQTRCVVDPNTVPLTFDELPAGCPYLVTRTVVVDGVHVLYMASEDLAGNKEPMSAVQFKLDGVPPTLRPAVTPTDVVLGGTAAVSVNASDAGSGLAMAGCTHPDTASVGSKTVTCTATDNAGNTSSATTSYQVSYAFGGLLQPVSSPPAVNSGKVGRTYPIQWQLRDATGIFETSLTAVTGIWVTPTDCTTFSTLQGPSTPAMAAGSSQLRYDAVANEYVFNWQTTQAGCFALRLTLNDGRYYTARFRLSPVPVRAWIGLKNGDDQGTNFDLRAELLDENRNVVASGLTRCVTGVTRNPALAKEVTVTWDSFAPVPAEPTDDLALRLSTRIGTNPDGTKCVPGPGGSHSNAVDLRVYYDSTSRLSRFDMTIGSSASTDEYLHSNGSACTSAQSVGATNLYFDATAPTDSRREVQGLRWRELRGRQPVEGDRNLGRDAVDGDR